MKTFIYLPLIALIVLTSCKSNKFTTQRYTNFGHTSYKKSTTDKLAIRKTNQIDTPEPVVPTEKVEAKVEKESFTPVRLIASGLSTLNETFLKPERKVYDLITNSAESISKEYVTTTNDSDKILSSQKTVKEKVKSDGFLGSALATALWIVLVVIFIILIIFLITVVF